MTVQELRFLEIALRWWWYQAIQNICITRSICSSWVYKPLWSLCCWADSWDIVLPILLVWCVFPNCTACHGIVWLWRGCTACWFPEVYCLPMLLRIFRRPLYGTIFEILQAFVYSSIFLNLSLQLVVQYEGPTVLLNSISPQLTIQTKIVYNLNT